MQRLIRYLGFVAYIILGAILGFFICFLTAGLLAVTLHSYHLLISIGLGAFTSGFIAFIRLRRYSKNEIESELAKHVFLIPDNAAEFIKAIVTTMRYRRSVRQDVQAELAAHFEDELKECASDEEREQKAQQLIDEFGDVKLLAVLLRRAKKRCRPLWRTIVARTFQTVGVLILCFIVYVAWFLTGRPTISVDYLAQLNQMNRPEVSDEGNAWPHYEKAIGLYVEPSKDIKGTAAFKNYKEAPYKDFDNLTEVEQEKIKRWVEQNEAAWQEFVAGSLKPYCYKESEYNSKDEEKWLFKILLPHLNTLRQLEKVGIWRSRIEVEHGQTQQGLEDCLVVAHVGSHWQGKGVIIEQLVGLAISRSAYEEILHIAAMQKLSATDLNQLHQQLLQIYPQGYPALSMASIRLSFLDTVQHTFTVGGPGGGHLIPNRWICFLDVMKSRRRRERFMPYIYTARGIIHARRDETIAKANEIYEQLSEIAKMSPYERQARNVNEEDIISALPEYRYSLIRISMSCLSRMFDIPYRDKSQYEALLTVLALQRWRLEKGVYPDSLEQLVSAGYLKKLPMDPYSDKLLVYKKTDDNFTLYSVERNFKDDGGEVFRDDKGRVRKWADEGDWVFWPVLKND